VPIRDSAKSAYDTTDDLALWLWFPYPEEKVADSFYDLYATWGIGWALKDLGISDVEPLPGVKCLRQ
jgi:3-methyladenine DNA glycosylase AlkD